jgi:hypothetical protein
MTLEASQQVAGGEERSDGTTGVRHARKKSEPAIIVIELTKNQSDRVVALALVVELFGLSVNSSFNNLSIVFRQL